MARQPKFKPKYSKRRKKWTLSIPPTHSPTGKRMVLSFDDEKAAKTRADAITDKRSPLPKIAVNIDPQLIADAVQCDDAVRSLGFRGLKDFVEQQIARIERTETSPRLGELLDIFESDHSGNWSLDYLRARWKPFRNKLIDLEETRIAHLVEDVWRDWFAAWRNSSNPAPATYNQQLGMTRSIFELRLAKISHPINPLNDIPALKDIRGDVPVFTPQEARKVLYAAWEHDPDLVPYFAIALFAGLRPDSELIRLKFEDIRWKENHIIVEVTKTRVRRRFVDIEEPLRAWLEMWRLKKAKGSVIPEGFRKRWERIVRGYYTTPKASLASPGKWEPLVEWIPDITRHSYASYWEAAHRNEQACRERLAANMGHTSYKTFDSKYRNAQTPSAAEEFWGILPPASTSNIVTIA